MDVLCFDIGSGGITAARFNEQLEASAMREVSWNLHRDAQGRATLSAEAIESGFLDLASDHRNASLPAAVCIGSFMHSFLVLSSCCAPLTPISTWLDTTAADGIEAIREKLGSQFHERTGCHYHPMFPAFKLAANPPGRGNRVASPKAWLAWELTGSFVDDFGMAAASGLLNARSGRWDSEILAVAKVDAPDLPEIVNPDVVVGSVTDSAATRFGIRVGTPLVCGSGDGFLANIGSACTTASRMAITLGTSGVARKMVDAPSLNPNAGTFCYRASSRQFLLGCASSNGGNVLDWAREEFGPMEAASSGHNIPIFLPWMNGERSLEWNPDLRPVWHGRTAKSSPADLARAATEGVLFNLVQYVEVIERESGVKADTVVLSGNGFREPALAPLLAGLLDRELLLPAESGLASLRGAAIYAWRALGHDAMPELEGLLNRAQRVKAERDAAVSERFARFKELRGRG